MATRQKDRIGEYEVRSSTSDRTYDVVLYKDGSSFCSCPAWRFQKGRTAEQRECKHTRSVREQASREAAEILQAVTSR